MEKTIEDLRLEADALGLTYSKNIGADKLQAKIDEFYENESKAATIAVEKTVDERTTSKKDAMASIRELEKANMEAVVIKLTMVDKREASTATTAYFSNGDVAMSIPLDTWVEVPKIVAIMADEARCVIHIETDHGAVPKDTKKYVVEYKK